ncbi:MAG TPA: hypothetical protein VN830_00745 [Verrucomicrobiae bacterium]|nr:hypothetical protein [Verrucomicrobiae bacterium]
MRDRKARRSCVYFSLIIFLLCATSQQGFAQPPPPADPTSTLRDTLFAACSQNSTEFARALTVRNTQAFSRMTSATRTTLLKRFVLLDKPGQPRAEIDAAGDLSVYCATSDVTTQLQIGKPELRDNLAYISLTVKNAAAANEDDSHRVLMGFVREAGQWKLLSLGLLMLDLPSLAEEWDRAEIKNNEQSAVDSMKTLAQAIETYRKTYTRLPDSLAVLGPPPQGPAKSEKADLIDAELAEGRRDGYSFRYVIVGANASGAPAKYELAAIPIDYGRTGSRSFFRDVLGVLHGADRRGAVGSVTDPKVD